MRPLHPWNVSPSEAVEIQNELRSRLVLESRGREVHTVAGVDVAASRASPWLWAAVSVFTYPGLEPMEEAWTRAKSNFPYIPGLLGFREIPPLLDGIGNLRAQPDLILCDGQGIAHPRGMGFAAHLGLLLGKPTIGCAKSRLVGEFMPVGGRKGDASPLVYRGRTVGAVLRTRPGVKPLFVSPGYGINLEEAVHKVLSCVTRYRVPEPVRRAHLLANRLKGRDQRW